MTHIPDDQSRRPGIGLRTVCPTQYSGCLVTSFAFLFLVSLFLLLFFLYGLPAFMAADPLLGIAVDNKLVVHDLVFSQRSDVSDHSGGMRRMCRMATAS